MSKRLTAALILFALLLSLCPVLFAFAEEEEEPKPRVTVRIRTAEDLMKLAADCSLDTWSDDKRVVLERDLSLSGVDFDSIPIFNGEFDGLGHTIYDLSLNSASSPCGFFLETGPEANIHDLNVSGSVYSRGDDTMVGGIVGRNRGLMSNCSFSGDVSARIRVGGVVGLNEASGILTACTASGSVRGLSQTGGVAGENLGTLVSCENRSFVNTESVDPSLQFEAIDTSSLLNFIRSLRSDNAGITTDTGGIAGSSSGFVEHCVNSGAVGYLHLGYNVGGVVGRSSGYVNDCSNSGEVYGRKDVGGVVGQAEPFINSAEALNLLSGISYRLYTLNQSLNNAAEDARYASSEISERFRSMSEYTAPIADAVRELDWTDPASAWAMQDLIAQCVQVISDEMYELSNTLDQQSGVLMQDVDNINAEASALSYAAIQAADAITSGQTSTPIVEDSSASSSAEEEGEPQDESEKITLGKIADSDNSASVYGDSNVGGIAGNISIENDLDPESELSSGGSILVQNKYSLSAVIAACVNRGTVTAKRECAGGIVGKADFGLMSRCASYGPVSLEDGDYAGGVCGLCYGSVKRCFVKCSLSGKRYIGGVIGNGFKASRSEERDSFVSGCYALTEILGKPQFAGAVSGGGAGVYEHNFFVPSGYAGLDRLSIHGQAEPMRFADFAAVEGLPEECRTFRLRFVVDGAVVKELRFDYGASFDRSVFPRVERRDGAYAVWDRGELSDLRFDTTVTAEYRLDESVLRSEEQRADGRAAVYVDGQFQQGDALELTQIPVADGDIDAFSSGWQDTVREQLRSIFREHEPDYSIPVSVAERLRVSFPDDGLETHTIRYLPPDGQTGNYRLYLAGEDGWQRVQPKTFGSYFVVDVSGCEAELCLVSTIQSWWIAAYIAAGLLILVLLTVCLVKLHKLLQARPKRVRPPWRSRPVPRWLRAHRKGVLIALPVLILAAAAAVMTLRVGNIGSALSAYRVIKEYSQRESDVQTDIRIHMDERDVEMSTTVHRVMQNGRMIRCTEQYGVPLYISGGMVCLENGRVFRLAEGQLSQGRVLDLALDVFLHEQVQKTEEGELLRYDATIDGETSDRILRLFLSANDDNLLHADSMTVSLRAFGGELSSLSFSGSGTAVGGTAFGFDVTLTPQPMTERPAIPQAVLDAIESGGEGAQILTEDLLKLLSAWIKNESAETVCADISVNADCGSLTLTPLYRYSRSRVDGTDIHCVKSALFTLYYTDSAACTSAGQKLNAAQQRVADASQLIPIARELCLNGQFSCTSTEERSVYTVTLSGGDAEKLIERLVPELSHLSVSYSDCRLRITVSGGALETIELDCGGSVRVVSRDVPASVLLTARFNDSAPEAVPAIVRSALLG